MPGTTAMVDPELHSPPRSQVRGPLRCLGWGASLALVLAGAWELARVFVGANFHVVIPGRVYRCSQPAGASLADMVRRYQIRTVVNLRGCGVPLPWYMEESRATHRLEVAQEDISLSAGRLPSVPEVRRLVEVLDNSDYPILFHCRQGADRTGLASVVVLLLQTDQNLSQARRQLGLRYGHVPFDRAANLDWFFDLYADWLRGQERRHSPAAFREWVDHGYCPGTGRCTFEPLDVPLSIPRDQPAAFRIRVHNTSCLVWHLRQESNAGIHGCFVLKDAFNRGLLSGRFGMFNADVPPGASIDLTMVVPALKHAGHYRYFVDMVDEQQSWFSQVGAEPMEGEIEVHD
jgi:hypothetical protein